MTQLRKFRDAISNYFDEVLRGLGKRDSSFMDMDAVSHDKDTGRFLFMEFKEPGEPLHPAARMVLKDLAGLPKCTVWFVRRLDDGRIGLGEFGSGCREEALSVCEFQQRYRRWWFPDEPCRTGPLEHAARETNNGALVTAAEIPWSGSAYRQQLHAARRRTWFMCPKCGSGYASNQLNAGRCGDLSRDQSSPCDGILMEFEEAADQEATT